MKLNKKPMFSSTGMAAMSLSKMNDAMKELTQFIAETGHLEVLKGALMVWPHPAHIRDDGDGKPVYLDTEHYEFLVRSLLELWPIIPIPTLIEKHFNEAEAEDFEALHDMFLKYGPNESMTLNMFMDIITKYFDASYPLPKPETFTSLKPPQFNYPFVMDSDPNQYLPPEQKDYFLPGLKVLNLDSDGVLWSPVYAVPWKDNELIAAHVDHRYSYDISSRRHVDQIDAMEYCDCGIYASINLSELWQYLNLPSQQAINFGMDERFGVERRRLCIIEPFSDASVYMARKGWKASKAFISEIVGETISPEAAANLMSMVWNRPLDLRKLFDRSAYK